MKLPPQFAPRRRRQGEETFYWTFEVDGICDDDAEWHVCPGEGGDLPIVTLGRFTIGEQEFGPDFALLILGGDEKRMREIENRVAEWWLEEDAGRRETAEADRYDERERERA